MPRYGSATIASADRAKVGHLANPSRVMIEAECKIAGEIHLARIWLPVEGAEALRDELTEILNGWDDRDVWGVDDD